jgi:hypothetical protein
MSITITGVVKNGVVVPNAPLPEGAQVEIRVNEGLPDVTPKLQDGMPAGANALASGDELRERFQKLAHQWKEECGPVSSARRMAAYPAYRAIVNMGRAAVPLLLAELERQPDHWFIALHELTGAEPVPQEARGRIDKMAAAWVKWGRENGFLPRL